MHPPFKKKKPHNGGKKTPKEQKHGDSLRASAFRSVGVGFFCFFLKHVFAPSGYRPRSCCLSELRLLSSSPPEAREEEEEPRGGGGTGWSASVRRTGMRKHMESVFGQGSR